MFTQLDGPNANLTEVNGINDAGQIVGVFSSSTGNHGFVYNGGSFTFVDFPGSPETVPQGINNQGQIVGTMLIR